jgi:hypothetical protein
VAEVRRHAWEANGTALSQDEALLLAFGVELEAMPPSCKPVSEPVPGDERCSADELLRA